MNVPSSGRRWAGPAALAALCFLPLLTDSYTQYLVNLVLAYIVIGIGLNLLLGYAGQFAFAHSAFMGIGAYTTALLMARMAVPFWLALPAGGSLAAALGWLVGLPALRMRGLYLAMATLAFTELVQWVLIHWKAVTLGTDGVNVPPASLLGLPLGGDKAIYYPILVVTAAMTLLARRILASRYGRAFVALRDSEPAAQAAAVSLARYKTLAFALSAFYAGIGGGLFALALRYVVPDGFGLFQVIIHFAIVMVGGLGTFAGPLIGSALLTALPELLRGFQAYQEIAYGILLVLVVLCMPGGVAGFLLSRGWLRREALVADWDEELALGAAPPLAEPGRAG